MKALELATLLSVSVADAQQYLRRTTLLGKARAAGKVKPPAAQLERDAAFRAVWLRRRRRGS